MRKRYFNVLITSAGRRVALVKCFKESLNNIENLEGNLITVDANPLAAALYVSDKHYLVPKIAERNFIDVLLNICQKEKVNLVIPTIDTELLVLSKNKEKFKEKGIIVLVSGPEVIKICSNKFNTFKFFEENDIPTVNTFTYNQIINKKNIEYPLFIKPCEGSSSIDTYKINNINELNFFINYVNDPIIQEFARGEEYTLDVLADFGGKVINVVPRKRIETRAGEINKGKTVKNKEIINYGKMIVEKLRGIGVITIQCFVEYNEIKFTEINPRFGGGYPLSFASGANYPEQLIRMVLGEKIIPQIGEFEENIVMLRWEDAIYIKEEGIVFKKEFEVDY